MTRPTPRTSLFRPTSPFRSSNVSRATRLRTPAAVLLAAAFVALPATTTPAYADTIRARQWGLEAMHTTEAWRTTKGRASRSPSSTRVWTPSTRTSRGRSSPVAT